MMMTTEEAPASNPALPSAMDVPDGLYEVGGDSSGAYLNGKPPLQGQSSGLSSTPPGERTPSRELADQQAKKEQEEMDKLLGKMESIQVLVRVRPLLEVERRRGCEAVG